MAKSDQPIHLYRTRIGRDIVAEFLPPLKNVRVHKCVILCDGLPTVPSKKSLMEYLAGRGYWVFHPRYRGTWESAGQFLRQSPVKDIYDVIEFLDKEGERTVTELYGGMEFELHTDKIFLMGSSFGGAAAIASSLHQDVDKIVAFSPVVDFTNSDQGEDPTLLKEFTTKAFGKAYRSSSIGWKRLFDGNLMNPISYIKKLDDGKIFIIHSRDDRIVHYEPVEEFAEELGCKFWLLRSRGHMSTSIVSKVYNIYKRVRRFMS